MSAKVNWGKIFLISFLSAVSYGIYEFTNALIDRGNISDAGQTVNAEGVERKIVGPNMYRVTENGFANTFNFASHQMVSNTEKTETITLFSAMDNQPYLDKTLTDACNVATGAVQKLEGMTSWSLLPWRANKFTAAQETARSFIKNHCPQPGQQGG